MMPNRYLPSALSEMVEEVHEDLLTNGKGDELNDVAEYEALVSMLQPKYQQEFKRRRGELDE